MTSAGTGQRRDFATEVEQAQAELTRDRFRAVEKLRALEEQWARALLGLSADDDLGKQVRRWVEERLDATVAAHATAHLNAAEGWQWEIGTWSTGSGEGLASMAEVRRLQAAQAWLRAAAGDVARALSLIEQVEGDSNGMGRWEADSMRALRERLGTTG